MKKKLLLILFFIFGIISIKAQIKDSCKIDDSFHLKKRPWRGNNAFLKEYAKKYPKLSQGHNYYYIPLEIHIFMNPNEKPDLIYKKLKNVIYNLNKIYSENYVGIQFYVADLQLHRNYNHLKTGYFFEAYFVGLSHKNKYAINVYYINVLSNAFNKKTRYRGMYNSMSKSIVLIRHCAKTTLAHEIGHFLGLKHPHRNSDKGKLRQESVSRTRKKGIFKRKRNCEVNGDFLADTPAEPKLTQFTDKNCRFKDNLTDNWGDKYHPRTDNIMSYPKNPECRTSFTFLQTIAMLYTAEHSKYSELWANCPENQALFPDKYEPDNFLQIPAVIVPNQSQYHTFHRKIKSRKKFVANDVDVLVFKPENKAEYLLDIDTVAGNNFPKMFLTVVSSENDTVFSQICTTHQQLTLNNAKFYYIFCEDIDNQQDRKVRKYKITVR